MSLESQNFKNYKTTVVHSVKSITLKKSTKSYGGKIRISLRVLSMKTFNK